ncbi:porimin isoform X1 [Dermochelys coriacea]|uniref:porimin isoform X1 n=1 Tax=Dermochelys coriacea TaxID=27794 RepID=UPI0018E8A841|nr:porimin isoform X1 [Dermochelys coriacea]
MRRSAGAASPLRAAALLLAAGCLAALGATNTSIPTTITQSTSNISACDKNATLTTISGSTKATTIQITTTTTTTQTNTTAPNQTTTSATVSKPTTAIQSTASVTVTTSNTMSPSSSVRATPKSAAVLSRTSRFDVGSFFGGIVLTLGMLAILYVGCKTYHSRRGVQYRTIDEHDAII